MYRYTYFISCMHLLVKNYAENLPAIPSNFKETFKLYTTRPLSSAILTLAIRGLPLLSISDDATRKDIFLLPLLFRHFADIMIKKKRIFINFASHKQTKKVKEVSSLKNF